MKKIILLLVLSITLKFNAQTFPTGFSQVKVGTVYYPTSMAMASDGRIFVTEKAGRVKIVKNGAVLTTPFYQLTVDQLNERGLSSVALDPNFSTNNYVYIYYTTPTAPIHNRLSRITANGDVAVPGSEVVIYDFDSLVNSIHNGGGMTWGSDGTLYLAVGNDNVNTNSPDLESYKGKVLRINTDFSVPSGNPFTSGSETKKRIWAYGLRNPWTIAMQPGTGKLFVDDVGEASWEEINDATAGGENFGWPGSEGMTTNPAYTNPLYTYPHGTTGSNDGCAITGGTFLNSSATNYPSTYSGKYFFIDYCNNWINYIDPSNGTKTNFATGLPGSENYIKTGSDGNLYYFSIGQNSLYKIIYSGNNAAAITSDPTDVTIPQGQTAIFTVTASGTSPLTYEWRKNGTAITGAPNSATYTINNAQPADTGLYSAYVSNAYGSDSSKQARLKVTVANAKPVATILTPASGTFYRDGDVISFSGSGTDLEDGVLPASAFQWTVLFHHDMHTHPGPYVTPGIKNGTFTATFGETSANVYFHLILVVSDAQGQKDSAFVDIHPITSTVHLLSQPSGLQVTLEEQPFTTPYSVLAVSGMTRQLGVVTPITIGDSLFVFDHWSQGGAASQDFVVNDNDVTFTAVYSRSMITSAQTLTANATALQVFPNPTNGDFKLILNAGNTQSKKIILTIVNSIGQEILRKDCVIGNDGFVRENLALDQSLSPGIYSLQLISEKNVMHTSLLLEK